MLVKMLRIHRSKSKRGHGEKHDHLLHPLI
jgi:hypothetical protein